MNELEQIIIANSKRVHQTRQDSPFLLNQFFYQAVSNLKNATTQPWVLTGDITNETEVFNSLLNANARFALNSLFLSKLILAYVFKQMDVALICCEQTKQYLDATKGLLQEPMFYFYDSLIQLRGEYSSYSKEKQQQILERVAQNQVSLNHWLPHSEMNFRHKYDLVEAEISRVKGNLLEAMDGYEIAITGAEQNEYVQDAALAYELAGEYYLSSNKDKIALLYFREAHFRYQQWGAVSKLNQLEQLYPSLVINSRQTLSRTTTTNTTQLTSVTGGNTINQLDLSSVMKAGRAISGEIVLDKLLEKMMRIVIENAGAQRGLLILRQDHAWLVQAKIENNAEIVEVMHGIPLEQVGGYSATPELPLSVVNYVIRTKESVVLSDAIRDGKFAQSAYIKNQKPKSTLCMPLLNQGRISGILYLENNLITGAFTEDRLELLNLLSSQITISIENAMLYNELEKKVAERTVKLDKALSALWSEMALAKRIQTCLLPEKLTLPGFDIVASCDPIAEVGGDYYDVLEVEGYYWLVIGDVSGHGVTSGLVMMMVQTAIHTVITNNPTATPEKVLNAINGIIYDNIIKMDEAKHMTILLMAYGTEGRFYFSGLHEDILLYRAATQAIEQIETDGFWIGIDQDISHLLTTNQLTLQANDCLILFTDGITEARNEQGFFGKEKLLEQVTALGQRKVEEIHAGILRALKGYTIKDDVTLMVVKRR